MDDAGEWERLLTECTWRWRMPLYQHPPALPHVAMPSTGPSVLSEAPEVPTLRPSLPLPPSHISHARCQSQAAPPSPRPTGDGSWARTSRRRW